jgi:argininosuccinate lyase
MVPGILGTLKVNVVRSAELAGAYWSGTSDLAAVVVRERGLPWRTAHQIVATLVRIAIEDGIKPDDVTSEYLDRAAVKYPDYGKPLALSTGVIQDAMDPHQMVNRRTLIGGPAPIRVREEIERSRRLIIDDAKKVRLKREKLKMASEKMEKAIDALVGYPFQN